MNPSKPGDGNEMFLGHTAVSNKRPCLQPGGRQGPTVKVAF